ncbi:MAG: type-F conjugative transfer system secretin TraK [Pseudomonadota bacterium]
MLVIRPSITYAAKYQYHNEQSISTTISGKELNRINITGDRIKEVIGLPQDFIIETEANQGQIFIKPYYDNIETVVFTVITEHGRTQSFRCKVDYTLPSQTIIIDIPHYEVNEPNFGIKHLSHREIVDLIKKVAQSNLPTKLQPWQKSNDLKHLSYRQLLSKNYTKFKIELWQVRNDSQSNINLSEKQFVQLRQANNSAIVKAIALEDLVLRPQQITQLYKVIDHGKKALSTLR